MSWRDGYRVIRKAGPLPGVPAGGLQRDDGLARRAATAWSRSGTACRSSRRSGPARPHIIFLHHVHAEMWDDDAAAAARPGSAALLESRVAPPLYRRTPIVTLSSSSKQELVDDLGFKDHLVHVVPPGIDPRFSPGRHEVADPARRRRRPARAGEAVRPPHRGAGRAQARAIPTSRPSSSARATSATSSRPRSTRPAPSAGSRCRAASPTTSSSTCTGGPGCSRAPRRARAGA